MKVIGNIELANGQIINLVIEKVTELPETTIEEEGRLVYDTVNKLLYLNVHGEFKILQYDLVASGTLAASLGEQWLNPNLSFNPTNFNNLPIISGLDANSSLYDVLEQMIMSLDDLDERVPQEGFNISFKVLEIEGSTAIAPADYDRHFIYYSGSDDIEITLQSGGISNSEIQICLLGSGSISVVNGVGVSLSYQQGVSTDLIEYGNVLQLKRISENNWFCHFISLSAKNLNIQDLNDVDATGILLGGVLKKGVEKFIAGFIEYEVEPIMTNYNFTPSRSVDSKYFVIDSASPCNFTILQEEEPLAVNSQHLLSKHGDGNVTIVAGSGVTINYMNTKQLVIGEKYGMVFLKRVALNTWDVYGELINVTPTPTPTPTVTPTASVTPTPTPTPTVTPSASYEAVSNVVIETGTTVLLGAEHYKKYVVFTSNDPISVEISSDSTYEWPEDSQIEWEVAGLGDVTFTGQVGVTVNLNSTFTNVSNGQYSAGGLKRKSVDNWTLFGNLELA